MRTCAASVVVCLCCVLVWSIGAQAGQIMGTTAHVWPNERVSDQQPPYCVDGDTLTYTWCTEAWNLGPNHLALDVGSLCMVSRIRLWKDNYDGFDSSPGNPDPVNAKNLVIEYTASSGDLELREWHPVVGLVNGYEGAELMHAAAVNADGATVTLDVHDSVNEGHGWASLSFTPVAATAVRITFSSPIDYFNHYKVHEFEVYSPDVSWVEQPVSWGGFKSGFMSGPPN